MPINLARMGAIRAPEDDGFSYDPSDEARKIQLARDLRRRNAQDLRTGEIDLAAKALQQRELERTTGEAERARGIRRDYIVNREGALDLPIGVRAPEFVNESRPSNAPFGPLGEPAKRNPLETRATIDLAMVNPDLAEQFRTGNISERNSIEDRTRKIMGEDQSQIQKGAEFSYKQRKDESDAAFEARKQAETERNNRAQNNIDWFKAKHSGGLAGKPIPASAQTQILENVQNAKKAQKALSLLYGNDVGSQKGDKKPTGFWKGMASTFGMGTMLDAADPSGIATRAAIADLGSMVIHDRSGAAVTASESPRLRPFIPSTYDSPSTAKTKLKRFIQEYNSIVQDQAQQYSPDAGYNESPLIKQYMENMPTAIFDSEQEAEGANLPPGTRILVNGREAVIE